MASKRERKLKKWKSRIERDRKLATKHHKQFDNMQNTKEIEIRIQLFNQKFRRMSKSIYSSIISRTNKLVNSLKPINKEYTPIHTDKRLPSQLAKHHNTYSFVDSPNVDLDYLDTHNSDVNPINLSQLSARWEEHQIDILSEHTDWSVNELSRLYTGVDNIKAQLGIGRGTRYDDNYAKAGSRLGEERIAETDFNAILKDKMHIAPNNARAVIELTHMAFLNQAKELFNSSDQVKLEAVLNELSPNTRGQTISPAERKRMREL